MSYNYNTYTRDRDWDYLTSDFVKTNTNSDYVNNHNYILPKTIGDVDEIYQTDDSSQLNDIELDVIVSMHRSPIHNPGLFIGMHIDQVTKEMYDAYPDYKLHFNNVNVDVICHSGFCSTKLNIIVDINTNIIKAIFFG